MIDALNLEGPANLELIHVEEPRELAYWAHVLDVPEEELRQIVAKVGPRAIDVRRHLVRARRAAGRHKAHPSWPQFEHPEQASQGDLLLPLILCCAAAAATAFGALAYEDLKPSDEWSALQRQHGCEAALRANPKLEQVHCPDGRTVGRPRFADAGDGPTGKPMR